ncbi:MAG: putative secreted protein putative xanthan lyase related [Fibrobacteres bacterium]|nr:putative secreted protein putative xanthan lyase related [Fibrobacterota bacterium]
MRFAFAIVLAAALGARAGVAVTDVVVYGGTAAGVVAAVAAAREGATVTLVEPGMHLGGMASGGLGWTDFGKKECIGGMSLEFFERLGKKYNTTIAWTFEPHVAESVFNEMAREAGVKIRLATRLKESGGVAKNGATITQITAENGDVFQGKVFLDATYEGDLMAQAGVSYAIGREASSQYGESLAGVRPRTTAHQFPAGLSPRGKDGNPFPEILATARGETGAGDKKIQAYNYRLCMTDSAAGRTAWVKPANYDPARYALLAHYVDTLTAIGGGVPPILDKLAKLSRVRGKKTDTNNNGGFSTDFIGRNWDYPEATYARRAEIWKEHKEYIQGFFWFLANDPSIPQGVRDETSKWGLAKDEFTDNGNWPHQLYVREARRMVGEYVMVQKDIQTEMTKSEGVGMGSYNSDSHHVQRIVNAAGAVENEGDMQVPVQPYEIPYRILTPKRAQASNLLVPVCFSASHVTYSTLRMEPQYMILGQAAGLAAVRAIASGKAVQEIDVQALRSRLKVLKAELGASPVALAGLLLPLPSRGSHRLRIALDGPMTGSDGRSGTAWVGPYFGISGRTIPNGSRGVSIAP